MPITTKLECAHCGSTLKTTKVVVPGAKVRCPKCKEVFHIHASDQDGMVETIPIAGDMDTMEVELPSSDQLPKMMKAAIREPLASAAPPPRMAPPSPTAHKRIEYGSNSVPFRGTRTIAAGICALIGVVFAGGFGWWYLGTVKSLDTAADVAIERRKESIQKQAAPPMVGKATVKPADAAKPAPLPTPPKDERVTAPTTVEIGEMVVGIVSARSGPLDSADARQVLTLGLRITNRSAKPMKYSGWARPEIKVTLRDMYGNFFNRLSFDTVGSETSIPPGETITDRLIFEKTPFQSEMTLDMPVPGTDKVFKFRITHTFIERAGAPSAVAAGSAPTQNMIDAAAGSRMPQMPTAAQTTVRNDQTPGKPEKYDPEQDDSLRGKILSDFREKMKDIRRVKLGKSSNNASSYERTATNKLVQRLAKDYELTEDQVKRIVKLK